MKIYNDDFKNIQLENKIDFILCDIPYNIGKNAYASNPRWWKNGNVKEGRSEKADSMFFETDNEFDLDAFLLYCYINLKEDGKVLLFCSIEQLSYIILNYKKYYFSNYTPLVFRKNNSSEVLKCNMRIVGCCEYGIVLYKGKLGLFNNENKMIKKLF